jgi:hypothetical protein
VNWNKWIRLTHRWLSVAIAQQKYTRWLGLLAVAPLALEFFTGMYLFVLPYASRWRARDTG